MAHHCEDIHCGDDEQCCTQDTERMNSVLDDIDALARAGSYRSASRRFGDLRLMLEQRMESLEDGAFSRLDVRLPGHPTRKLRETHFALHLQLDALGQALSEDAGHRVEKAVSDLRSCLIAHRAAEQKQLLRLTRG